MSVDFQISARCKVCNLCSDPGRALGVVKRSLDQLARLAVHRSGCVPRDPGSRLGSAHAGAGR